MEVTLGGDRLGSGNKNKLHLRNYERSTHNLTQKFTSSMQVGALYPFLKIPAMRGDTFEINLQADGRTIPTKGPLFGSFKMQIDLFQCPVRLYQAVLHNNPTKIGLKMNQVKLPILEDWSWSDTRSQATDPAKYKNNCLLKYLGISGIGSAYSQQGAFIRRNFQCIPVLAYYDIFKTYYANKQEEDAYVISGRKKTRLLQLESFKMPDNEELLSGDDYNKSKFINGKYELFYSGAINNKEQIEKAYFDIIVKFYTSGETITTSIAELQAFGLEHEIGNSYFQSDFKSTVNDSILSIVAEMDWKRCIDRYESVNGITIDTIELNYQDRYDDLQEIWLRPFKLKQIDDMRMKILSWNNFGTPFTLRDGTDANGIWGNDSGEAGNGLPYSTIFSHLSVGEIDDISYNHLFQLNGLVVKTYQSDLFNNWVRTEWIDGENGIAAVTAISTASGSFTMDSLNLAEKLYNMLNRVAVADGTYEGWQNAVYTQSPKRHIESPIYLGGMSSEIVFEEIVQTAPADGEPLGTLAGKGKILKRKGGRVVVKVDEASYIIGIVSLTPRINYTQGNDWDMTDLFSMDDFHKPALDGIGFQNLMQEQMLYTACEIDSESGLIEERYIAGKVPAWINYMTAVDKAYGDFAELDGNGFMVLQRAYENMEDRGAIADMTTYIDPTKFNYAFAYTDLSAQNFWIQILSDIKARRLMSAKQIPNL